ncbi:MAG: alpha/beta hydrolase [Dactylosporangium sp.]|nr:alpha/beta hydrolase [Dactylosporangium sp.]NNJ63033.1 alpha/beta hydrolase [Dactylosporangium sp.]
MRFPVDDSCVLLDGPWTHRFVNANGTRLHVVEAGSGPLLLLVHGFPEFWYAWQHQIPALAAAGFRVAAVDMRGYGASDKPPRGYDAYTMAADIVGLIRALGERSAIMVGSGYGGALAWTTACFHPKLISKLVVLSAPHPLRMRTALATDPRGQLAAALPLLKFQIPRFEHLLTRDDAALVWGYLRQWGSAGWTDSPAFTEYAKVCRQAMLIPQAAFCAMEAYRWTVRSALRPQGLRYVQQLQQPITSPTLQLHGALDPAVLPRTAQGSGRFVAAEYAWRVLEGVGHFAPQEAPDAVTREVLSWAGRPS